MHSGRIPTPAGNWALLVALPGQSWAYLLPGHLDDGLSGAIAGKAGVRVIDAGYSDFSNATGFCCVEGHETLVRFESCGLGGESEVVEQYTRGPDEALSQTLFVSTKLPKEWLKPFKYERDVLEALAKEFDAFIPYMTAPGPRKSHRDFGFWQRTQAEGLPADRPHGFGKEPVTVEPPRLLSGGSYGWR